MTNWHGMTYSPNARNMGDCNNCGNTAASHGEDRVCPPAKAIRAQAYREGQEMRRAVRVIGTDDRFADTWGFTFASEDEATEFSSWASKQPGITVTEVLSYATSTVERAKDALLKEPSQLEPEELEQ